MDDGWRLWNEAPDEINLSQEGLHDLTRKKKGMRIKDKSKVKKKDKR